MVLDAVSNFVRGRVSAAVDTSDTTVSVEDASIFPDPATDGEYNVVIWDANNFPRPDQDSDVEIMRVTARDTGADELTVVRGQETTSDVAHPEGSAVHLSPTAKMFSDIKAEYTAQGENFDGQGTSEFSNLQSLSTDSLRSGEGTGNESTFNAETVHKSGADFEGSDLKNVGNAQIDFAEIEDIDLPAPTIAESFEFGDEEAVIDIPDRDRVEIHFYFLENDDIYLQVHDRDADEWLDDGDYGWALNQVDTGGTDLSDNSESDDGIVIVKDQSASEANRRAPITITLAEPRRSLFNFQCSATGAHNRGGFFKSGGTTLEPVPVDKVRVISGDGEITDNEVRRAEGWVVEYRP